MERITWQSAKQQGLRIYRPRRKKENRFRDVPGETSREKAYWILFTLGATEEETAEVMQVSKGEVYRKKKDLGFKKNPGVERKK